MDKDEILKMRDRLENLSVLCEKGCEGRCRDCPQDAVGAAIELLTKLAKEA